MRAALYRISFSDKEHLAQANVRQNKGGEITKRKVAERSFDKDVGEVETFEENCKVKDEKIAKLKADVVARDKAFTSKREYVEFL